MNAITAVKSLQFILQAYAAPAASAKLKLLEVIGYDHLSCMRLRNGLYCRYLGGMVEMNFIQSYTGNWLLLTLIWFGFAAFDGSWDHALYVSAGAGLMGINCHWATRS